MTATIEKPMTVSEAGEYLGLARSTIYQLINRKAIPYSKPNNGYVYFKKQDLDDYLNRGRVAAGYETRETAEKILAGGKK